MNFRKTIWVGIAAIMLLQTKAFGQPTALMDTNALVQMIKAFETNLATNPPLSDEDFTNKTAALASVYQQRKLDKGVLMAETWILENNRVQNIYGKVIDQYGQPVADVDVAGNVALLQGWDSDEKYKHYKTKTDTNGLFQFTGLRGASISADVTKEGYEIDYRIGYTVPAGKKTSPDDRAILTMWKLKGPEPMIHRQKFYGITPDWRIFTIDLVKHKKIEGTNAIGDLLVQIQRPAQIGPQDRFDWAFAMTAIDGGFIEITNDGYLNEAPESGYQPQYKFNMSASEENANWKKYAYSRYVGVEKTFYFKSRNGQVYGHFHIKISPNYNDTSALDIEYYINPSGSRNLEWDGRIQIE
jgi:hypothetical protein